MGLDCFSLCYVARFVEPEIGDFFFPFLWILFLGADKDLRLDHNEDKFRPNNTPDWHFFGLMDQIPERRRSYWEVQAGSC